MLRRPCGLGAYGPDSSPRLMTIVELLLGLALIVASAVLAASEIALFSLSRSQLRTLKENFNPVYRKLRKLLADPLGLLTSLLVLNEVFNIALSGLIAQVLNRQPMEPPALLHFVPAWAYQTGIGLVITTPILLFCCEITPKVVGARANHLVSSLTVGLLTSIYRGLKPIRALLSLVTNAPDSQAIIREADFLFLLEEGKNEGAIQVSELDLIRNVFALDHTTVEDVLTPFSRVFSLSAESSVRDALITMRTQRFSRIPIVEGEQILGVLYAKDILNAKLHAAKMDAPVTTLMRKPIFVSSSMSLNALFRKFKQQKIHMGIVQSAGLPDRVGGVVTMSDILDALFNDLYRDAPRGRGRAGIRAPIKMKASAL